MTVLTIDDIAMMRDVLGSVARSMDCIIYEAANEKEALKAILEHKDIDVVLLDLKLGENNYAGLELLPKLLLLRKELTVLMCSGTAEFNVVARALKAGAKGFIAKPINCEAVKLELKKAQVMKSLRERTA